MDQAGEVIETATGHFVGQSYQLNVAPPYGSLVWAPQGEREALRIYGVVADIETKAVDPSRPPIARGREANSLEEIYRAHPQLPELFRTQFTVRVLGFQSQQSIYHYLPPLPPEIHQLVFGATETEVAAFTERFSFMPLLLAAQGPQPSEELAASFLRHAGAARGAAARDYLVRAGKALVPLLRGESVRLASLLGRLR